MTGRSVTGRRPAMLLVAALAGALLVGCGPAPTTPGPTRSSSATAPSTLAPAEATPGGQSIELTVYAAASLREAVEALTAAYAEVAPGISVTVSTGASSALRAQIEQGAPADVFLSADTTHPAALLATGLSAGEPKVIAGNRLAIIVPTPNPAALASPADLARPGIKIVAAGDEVPITRYAGALVENLAKLEGYPPGFAAGYAANVVSREDDVKAVVAKIELGEGDAAIAYRTDALASTAVTSIEIPPAADVTASYAGVLVGASRHLDEARGFLDWLNGAEAQAILASFGFSPPGT
jgi:molybdate transport system substrate-binding protein